MSIQKRSNGTYLVRWRERPGAPEKSKAFAKKRDAENFETTTKAAIQTGTFVDPMSGEEKTSRSVMRHVDENHFILEMFGPGPDGKEYRTMELHAYRKS